MSSSTFNYPLDQAFSINNDNPISPSKKSMIQKLDKNSKINRKMTRVSNKIRPESALLSMIKLIVEHRDQIKNKDE